MIPIVPREYRFFVQDNSYVVVVALMVFGFVCLAFLIGLFASALIHTALAAILGFICSLLVWFFLVHLSVRKAERMIRHQKEVMVRISSGNDDVSKFSQ